MYILWFALAAFAGGMAGTLLGWLNSGEPFVCRKFTASAITALVSALGAAGSSAIIMPTSLEQLIVMLLVAFVAATGVDALRHYAYGSVKQFSMRQPPIGGEEKS